MSDETVPKKIAGETYAESEARREEAGAPTVPADEWFSLEPDLVPAEEVSLESLAARVTELERRADGGAVV